MSVSIDYLRVRLALDTAEFAPPREIKRGAMPMFWRSNDVRFEIGVFFLSALVDDLSAWASITLEVRPLLNGTAPSPGIAPEMQKTAGSFDITLAANTWEDGSKQHVAIAFTPEETNIAAGDKWISIYLVTTAGRVVTLAAGPCRCLEDGCNLDGEPPAPTTQFYNKTEVDALIANALGGNAGTATYDGELQLDDTFGAFKVPFDRSLEGMAYECAGAPSGDDAVVQLLDETDAVLCTFTLAENAVRGYVAPSAPLNLVPGHLYHLKISQVGSAAPGTNLRMTPVLKKPA